MEDTLISDEGVTVDHPKYPNQLSIWGVFDGHGGENFSVSH
jgi:serine/threonine protein phosphatase PrpC